MSFLARATSFLGSLHEYASTHGNLRDGNVGFWSPHTSNVDWCETNYVYTQYVAEFFNTVTSIPIFLMGVFGVVHGIRNGYRKRFLVPLTTIALIGIGSIAFHATLRKEGQAMDELSMIWGATAMLFSVIETKRDINRQWLAPALLVYLSLFTAAYLLAPADSLIFPVFLLSYSFAIIGLLFGARAYYSQIKNATVQRMLVISTICFFGSFFLFWLPDKLACAQVQRFQLHAIFHLLSVRHIGRAARNV